MIDVSDLNSSEESFLQILDAIGDLVLVKGPKSRLIWANQAFCHYYGMTNAQLKGMIDAPFSEPDHTQQYVKDDAHVFATGQVFDIPEEPVTRHDGVVRIFHTVKTPIFDSQRNVIMTVGISRDVTDRKEAEEKLNVERARSVNAAKLVNLGQMAGSVAHEINTPLSVITLLSGHISEILATDPVNLDLIKKNISSIDKTVERIAKIVSGLRAFSRDGRSDPKVCTKLSDVVEDTLSFSRERIVRRGIELKIRFPQNEPMVECKSVEIGQIVLNLLNNAYDALGGQNTDPWIALEICVKGRNVELTVADNGSGVTKDNRDKLFAPFFTTKEMGKGTGLGLSISREIAAAHGGSLELDSTSVNTRFVLSLPLAHGLQQ